MAFLAVNLHAEDAPKFLGPQSCATSGCHGGAGDHNKQYTVWAKYDVHHQRPFATLTTARSERIAATLKIADPTKDARCTACHAPMQTVPTERRDPLIKISDGVSCENCHGPAEKWILSHTRKDYTHAARVNAGMRDLQNLYVRANTCVACHQNVDADILAAGHPALIFELDGQCVTQPKHWQEGTNFNGAQAWEIGQEVAFREVNWQLANTPSPQPEQIARWDGLSWVLQAASTGNYSTNNVSKANPTNLLWAAKKIDDHRRANPPSSDATFALSKIDGAYWTQVVLPQRLTALANASMAFRDSAVPQALQAHRAERLVLGLDRLVSALPELGKNEPVQAALKQLFKDVQSLPDFQPAVFAEHLGAFQKALPKP